MRFSSTVHAGEKAARSEKVRADTGDTRNCGAGEMLERNGATVAVKDQLAAARPGRNPVRQLNTVVFAGAVGAMIAVMSCA